MKNTLTILAVLFFALTNLKAQQVDFYTVGYKDNSSLTRKALLYKNNELLYSIVAAQKKITPYKVACDTQGNVYWLVVYSEGSSTKQTEIWKNDELYLSNEGMSGYRITDLFCIGDTLFYVGNTTVNNGIRVATVWTGPDFTPHWVLGDGVHDSFIYEAAVDKNTNIPYCCGFITDSLKKASVWEASQLLYKQEPWGSQRGSYAMEISIDNGSIYTNGILDYDTDFEIVSIPTIWKDNENIFYASGYSDFGCLYAHQGDFYFTYYPFHESYFAVYKNSFSNQILSLPTDQTAIRRICDDSDDIYMVGSLQGQGCIWKNFEVYLQPNNCDAIYDMAVSYACVSIDKTYENGLAVYPNPADNILFVETQNFASLPTATEYRITNPTGQTLLQGTITTENQQINIEKLPTGMYFINVGKQTMKFVKQ